MTTAIPVACHPWPLSPERLELLKQAKASLNLDYLIVPVEWNPGSPGRPLCFGTRPPHYTKWAPIRAENVENVSSIAAALKFVLEADEDDDRFDEAAWLSGAMGCEVTEITNGFELDTLEFSRLNEGVRFT